MSDDGVGGASWEYSFDNDRDATQALAAGAVAADVFPIGAQAGDLVTTSAVTISVTGVNDTPTVTIDAPAAGVSVAGGATVDVAGTGADVDAGETAALTYTWSDASAAGGFTDAGVAATQWTAPFVSEETQVTLTLAVRDVSGAVASTAVTVTVTAAAVISGLTGEVTEDDTVQTATGQLTVAGESNPQFTLSTDGNGVYGTFTLETGGNWEYTLNNADGDTDALARDSSVTDTFGVSAAVAGVAPATVVITVVGANDAPAAAFTAQTGGAAVVSGARLAVGAVVTLAGTGTDPDAGADLSYAWRTGPEGQGTFTPSDAADTVWDAGGAEGEVALILSVTDEHDAVGEARLSVELVRAGITGDLSGTVTEELQLTDEGFLEVVTTGGDVAFIAQTNAGTYGTFELEADGLWRYTLDDDLVNDRVNALGTDEVREETFTVMASDRGVPDGTVAITVRGTNDAPMANAGTDQAVDEGGSVTLDGSGSSDAETSSASLTYEWTPPDGPAVTLDSITAVQPVFTAPAVDTDTDLMFRLTVNDGDAAGTAAVTVTVRASRIGDDADLTGEVVEDDAMRTTAAGTVTVSTDAGFEAQDRSEGRYGTFTLETGGGWRYVLDNGDPDTDALEAGARMEDGFTVRTTDGAEAEVRITVTGANDAAVFGGVNTGAVTEDVDERTTASATVTVSDVDGDDAIVSVSAEGNTVAVDLAGASVVGVYGMLEIDANGLWTYTLDNDDVDTDALGEGATADDGFTVTAADDTEGEVVITVTGANDAPVAVIAGAPATVTVGEVVDLDGSGSSDVDTGDTLTYLWSAARTGVGEAGGFNDVALEDPRWTAPGVAGAVTLTLTVTDTSDATDTVAVGGDGGGGGGGDQRHADGDGDRGRGPDDGDGAVDDFKPAGRRRRFHGAG